jgi:DNA topoisomerase-1
MNPAILDVTTIDISAEQYLFRAAGSILKFDGFMRLYLEGRDDSNTESNRDDETDAILPVLEIGERLDLRKLTPKQHYTQPPPRYTEATLVKALEEKGIGRPSTYAAIISTIQDREYVVKEKRAFLPTDMGKLVNQLLIKGFPDILDTQFTAKLEDQLDEIADGKSDWVGVLSAFYEPFNHALEAAPDVMYKARKEMEEESDEVCEKCNGKMVIKWGRYGRFLGCSNYPECRNIKRLTEDDAPPSEEEPTDEICDKCSSPMVIKTSRAGGKFLACTGYPKCKNAKPINIGVDCPEASCDGYIGERRSKRGKVFYGCSNYPKCNFVSWDRPVNKECPECQAPFLVERTAKTKKPHLACNDKACGYAEPLND